MTALKKPVGFGITLFTAFCAAVSVATITSSNAKPIFRSRNVAEQVNTPYSLRLDDSWGYSGESSKTVESSAGNSFTIGFSDGSKFGHSSENQAFTTTEDNLYIYTTNVDTYKLQGISQVYVKGETMNEKAGITVYGHFYKQTYLLDDSETVNGTLNSLISFEPTNYIAIEFKGIDNIEFVEIGYTCSEASDPFEHMMFGGANTKGNGYYQSLTGLSTDLSVGTFVSIEMDVSVTGTFNSYSHVYWINNVYTAAGGEGNKERTDILSTVVTGEAGWHHVTFEATVRNFAALRSDTEYVTQDTSSFGNAVYLIAITYGTEHSFNFKNVSITEIGFEMPRNGKNGNYYQNIVGVKTTYPVGTSVEVSMDIFITGTYSDSQYHACSIWWVDSVYSNNLWNVSPKIVDEDTAVANTGKWYNLTFEATVRNFPMLGIFTAVDTSQYGNAVYVVSRQLTENAFYVKNVSVTQVHVMTPAGDNGNNNDKYYQSIAGLSTELAVGTSVHVEMDVCVTGTFNSYSDIWWANSVYTTAGGELNDKTSIQSIILDGNDWHHVSFTATVRNFPALRRNSAYPVYDTSSYGNAVYLIAMNKSANSFSFKNVSVTAA